MRTWKLRASDPLSLHLAADARLTRTDYVDDQIWALQLAGGNPLALALTTTYGLRAREMRLFPSFMTGQRQVTNPADFIAPPVLEQFFVNYMRVRYQPLPGVEVVNEYWVPDSHTIAGRMTLTNLGTQPNAVRMQMNALLRALDMGEAMRPLQDRATQYLLGRTGNLFPVLILEHGELAEDSSWPAMGVTVSLNAAESRRLRWVQTARASQTTSLALCQDWLDADWRAELQYVADVNANLIDIETGDPDWDVAFAMAQKVALASYVGPTDYLPNPSFVFTRNTDRGYSNSGDGSDHTWQWNGQVATEAYVNLPQVAPLAPGLAKGIIRNYLEVQQPNGFIDWKPGLAGQRSNTFCIPLLATCAWAIYEYDEDQHFIAEVYAGLARFIELWFDARYDYDEDGLPEWQHTVQTAFDDNPSFVRWHSWAQGADISLVEAPDLASYLYRECRALAHMARLLGIAEDARHWAGRIATLTERVRAMWDDFAGLYHYVDRDSHASPPGLEFGSGTGDLAIEVFRDFDPPQRVLIRIQGPRDAQPDCQVSIHGAGSRGRRVEVLKRRDFSWYWGLGTVTSKKLYSQIKRIEVNGLSEDFQVWVGTVDYHRQDQTLLLPLWAGIPDDQQRAGLIHTLTDPERFWRAYGIPNCSAQDPAYRADNRDGSGGVWMMWNTMLGEGLADQGYADLAATLLTRLMAAVVYTLKTENAFREAYNADQLEGLGDRDYIWGIAPTHLFLRVLGVRIISPHRIWLRGANPFPWAVTVRHHGVTVTKTDAYSMVAFPNGIEHMIKHQDDEQFVVDEP